MALHIGTSGWSYNRWRTVLYPPGPANWRWLEIYAAEFDTVEYNGSFYRWPREPAFAAYPDRLPGRYQFSVRRRLHRYERCAPSPHPACHGFIRVRPHART